DGRVSGVRLDHTDGLYDPSAYFLALQQGGRAPGRDPFYAIAEKILGNGEELGRAWAVSGTTGYDFLAAANGLPIDRSAERALTGLYLELTGAETHFRTVARQAKRDVMQGTFASEIHMLAHALKRLAEKRRHTRDFTLASLLHVITETIA